MSHASTKSSSLPHYTPHEEIANALIHGLGVGLSIAGLTVLVVLAALYGDVWRVVSFSIYGTTLVMMFTASTLYHSFHTPVVKQATRIIDHSMIYLLIAGTYTPFMLVTLRGPWGWSLFGIIWGLALFGIVMKIVMIGKNRMLSTVTFVLMGWICIIVLKPMIENIPVHGMLWLVGGGLLYTFGVIFYVWRSLPYHHAVWHLFVLAGAMCHFFTILFYVL